MSIEHVLAQRVGMSLGDASAHLAGFFGANFMVGPLVFWALGWEMPLPHGLASLAIGLSLVIVGARSLMRAPATPQRD